MLRVNRLAESPGRCVSVVTEDAGRLRVSTVEIHAVIAFHRLWLCLLCL